MHVEIQVSLADEGTRQALYSVVIQVIRPHRFARMWTCRFIKGL